MNVTKAKIKSYKSSLIAKRRSFPENLLDERRFDLNLFQNP